MPGIEPFFDTNVVLYALSNEARYKERVAERMSTGGIVSTQVLAESANVMRRKFGRGMAEIETFHGRPPQCLSDSNHPIIQRALQLIAEWTR